MFVKCPYCDSEDTWVGPEYGPGAYDGARWPSEARCEECGGEIQIEYDADSENGSYTMYAIGLPVDASGGD